MKDLKGVGGTQAKGTRNRLNRELEGLDELTSTQLRTKTKYVVEDDLKLFRKDASSHEDIKKFLDNVEKSESTEGSSIFINNTQTFLLPLNSSSQQMFSGGEGSSFPNINITDNILDIDFSELNSNMMDELTLVKLYSGS